MQEHFNEKYMESNTYPSASYKGRINEKIDWNKNGTYKITSKGMLTIHGVQKERTDTATVSIKDGKISMKSDFRVTVADYKIKIPRLVFQNIAEVVSVKFNISYSSFKKEKE
jgi:polyisoprenoid-binding protein YceI